jgi:hypothetical protein
VYVFIRSWLTPFAVVRTPGAKLFAMLDLLFSEEDNQEQLLNNK